METVVKLYCLGDNDNKMQLQNSCNHRILLNYFIYYYYCVHMCMMCMSAGAHVSWPVWKGQKTTFRSRFF